jgi:hypothetical protein
MKRHNRHLTIMSITIMLMLTLLSCGSLAVTGHTFVADSHKDVHSRPEVSSVSHLDRAKIGSPTGQLSRTRGGQIGRLFSTRGGQIG